MTHQLELTALKRRWVEEAAEKFATIARGLGRFTFDDIHPILPKPEHLNWYGILAAKLKNRGLIRKLGYQPSKRREANGRPIGVWEVVG